MKWTSDKPTTPGWYWHRDSAGALGVCHVFQGKDGLWVDLIGCRLRRLADVTGMWSSEPIPEPETLGAFAFWGDPREDVYEDTP